MTIEDQLHSVGYKTEWTPTGLFERWLEIERATGRPLAAILDDLNATCGTKYRHNWPSVMAKRGYRLDRMPTAVKRYFMARVLPVDAPALCAKFSAKKIDALIDNLIKETKRMPTFQVELKRVTFATVRIVAESAGAARRVVEEDGAHEHFVLAQTIGTDTTTIAGVKRERDPVQDRK